MQEDHWGRALGVALPLHIRGSWAPQVPFSDNRSQASLAQERRQPLCGLGLWAGAGS